MNTGNIVRYVVGMAVGVTFGAVAYTALDQSLFLGLVTCAVVSRLILYLGF